MIKAEVLEQFKKTTSDSGYKIRKIGTNEIYDEAVDLTEKAYEYEETDIEIEQEVTE